MFASGGGRVESGSAPLASNHSLYRGSPAELEQGMFWIPSPTVLHSTLFVCFLLWGVITFPGVVLQLGVSNTSTWAGEVLFEVSKPHNILTLPDTKSAFLYIQLFLGYEKAHTYICKYIYIYIYIHLAYLITLNLCKLNSLGAIAKLAR